MKNLTTAYTHKDYRNLGANHFPVYEETAEKTNPLERRSVTDVKTNIFEARLISSLESPNQILKFSERFGTKTKAYQRKVRPKHEYWSTCLFIMCENLVSAGRGQAEVYYCDKRQVWDNPKVKFNIPEMRLL